MSRWLESVDEHRETLEEWADSDLPLAEDIEQLLAEADQEGGAG